jgi:hypothetical protein
MFTSTIHSPIYHHVYTTPREEVSLISDSSYSQSDDARCECPCQATRDALTTASIALLALVIKQIAHGVGLRQFAPLCRVIEALTYNPY